MRIKLFEQFEDIHDICKKYRILNYNINSDGMVDVNGNVDISSYKLTKIPLRFGKVEGNFDCADNLIKTLEGSPREVGGNFFCNENRLTTLLGGPEIVRGYYFCNNNELLSLEGAPENVSGVGFNFVNNPIYDIYYLFSDFSEFKDSLDWNYLRGGEIIKSRFEEACGESGVRTPGYIRGYKYI